MYLRPGVAHQRARQQSRLGQNLESIADAQHQPAAGRKTLHRLHHRREARNRARAQVVAVGKSARNQHRVHAVQILAVMPEEGRPADARPRQSRCRCRDRNSSQEKPAPRISCFQSISLAEPKNGRRQNACGRWKVLHPNNLFRISANVRFRGAPDRPNVRSEGCTCPANVRLGGCDSSRQIPRIVANNSQLEPRKVANKSKWHQSVSQKDV